MSPDFWLLAAWPLLSSWLLSKARNIQKNLWSWCHSVGTENTWLYSSRTNHDVLLQRCILGTTTAGPFHFIWEFWSRTDLNLKFELLWRACTYACILSSTLNWQVSRLLFCENKKREYYAHRHLCQPISVSLSNTECLVSTIMKLLSRSMRSGQGVKDRDRQGNQLSAARYFRSSH